MASDHCNIDIWPIRLFGQFDQMGWSGRMKNDFKLGKTGQSGQMGQLGQITWLAKWPKLFSLTEGAGRDNGIGFADIG